MKKTLRDNRGSITTIVTVTALFFSIILSTAYMVASTNRKTQLKSELTARETYEKPLNNLDEIREEVTGLPRTAETQPYFPSSDFKRISGTDLSNGLVIEDLDGNQYVWVEVPKNEDVYPTAGLNIVSFTDDEYTKIENDLHTYTSVYRNGTTYSDTWVADNGNEGWYTESEYYAQKKKMLKSVYQNGGFYVGRYEAGIAVNRTSDTEKNSAGKYIAPSAVPVSKVDAYPYTYVTRTQAKVLAEKVNSGNYTSSLMFGVQWDLVLAFMSKDTAKVTDTSILTSNSTSIGNYFNASFDLNRGRYVSFELRLSNEWNNFDKALDAMVVRNETTGKMKKMEQSIYINGVKLTTGGTEQSKVMNIYDMAGNVYEWTVEKPSNIDNAATRRGGGYINSGMESPAFYRTYLGTGVTDDDNGFRVSIY